MFIQREYCWLLQGENDGEKCILGHWGNEPPGPASSRGPPSPPITSQCQLLTLLPGVKCAQHQWWTFAASSCVDGNLQHDMLGWKSSRQDFRIVDRTVRSESPSLRIWCKMMKMWDCRNVGIWDPPTPTPFRMEKTPTTPVFLFFPKRK